MPHDQRQAPNSAHLERLRQERLSIIVGLSLIALALVFGILSLTYQYWR